MHDMIPQSIRVAPLIVALFIGGCRSNPELRPTDATVSLGGALKGAYGHGESGIYNAEQAKKLVKSGAAVPFIDATIQELGQVLKNILEGMRQLDRTTVQYNQVVELNRDLRGDIRSLKESERWKLGGYCIHLRRLFYMWIALIALCWIISRVAPPPWNKIAGIIGKVINPLCWLTWADERKALYQMPPGT